MSHSDSDDDSLSGDEGDALLSREELLDQIASYHRYFPDILSSRAKGKKKSGADDLTAKFVGKSDEFLRKELDDIKKEVSGVNMVRDLGGLIVLGAAGVQSVGSYAGLKLDGPKTNLTGVVQQNLTAFNSVTKELLCKYGGSKYCEPEIRLGLLCAQSILGVHAVNANADVDNSGGSVAGSDSSSTEKSVKSDGNV